MDTISNAGTSLDQMQPMQCGTICQVDMDDEAVADQLKAMGVCVGRMIEVVKRGDPLILRVLGSRIGVSARLAQRVRVSLCEADACQTPSPTTSPSPPSDRVT